MTARKIKPPPTPAELLKSAQNKAKTAKNASIAKITTALLVQAIRRELGRDIVIEYEYKFASKLKSKFAHDLYLPAHKLAIEIEGGTWGKSRHTSKGGYSKDIVKYNLSAMHGIALLRFTTEMVRKSPTQCARDVRDLINKALILNL